MNLALRGQWYFLIARFISYPYEERERGERSRSQRHPREPCHPLHPHTPPRYSKDATFQQSYWHRRTSNSFSPPAKLVQARKTEAFNALIKKKNEYKHSVNSDGKLLKTADFSRRKDR